jgi:hypothetical protein
VSYQIVDIVLYSHRGDRRVLSLRVGGVNVITGGSGTGKSAIVDIVDYCLGSAHCRVPDGPIRTKVAWFGLRLQLSTGQAFIARRCPDLGAQSTEDCFVSLATEIAIPNAVELSQTTNTRGLVALLTEWSGIEDNVHEPPAGQTRAPISAGARHALLLCFQPQDEIIRRQQLFHGASDHFVAQALRDVFPYLLGAVERDSVTKKEQLRRNREQLRSVERQIAELRAVSGDGVSKGAALLAQARDAGLTDDRSSSWEATVLALRAVQRVPVETVETLSTIDSEFDKLGDERRALLEEQRRLRDELSLVVSFSREESAFSREVTEQRARLIPIGVFGPNDAASVCPLCSQDLDKEASLPTLAELADSLRDVTSRLEGVTRSTPHLQKAVADLEGRLQRVQAALNSNREAMTAVREASDRIQQTYDEAAKRAHILGRISLYLESLPDLPDTATLQERSETLRSEIRRLEEELDDDRTRERVESITSILGRRMSEWAQSLRLEHSEFPLRLDLKRLTIVADKPQGPIPMDQMGSGENWVGYHLIGHLALHEWFTNHSRPVPRFLFLDQPSQVYFPAELDVDGNLEAIADSDRAAVSRMFRFVFGVVEALANRFQVVLTEHADINEPWYQDAVRERWRGGNALIPDTWTDRELPRTSK